MQVRIVLRESQKRQQDAYLLSRLVGQLVGDFRDGASSKSKRPSSGKKKVASQDRVSYWRLLRRIPHDERIVILKTD